MIRLFCSFLAGTASVAIIWMSSTLVPSPELDACRRMLSIDESTIGVLSKTISVKNETIAILRGKQGEQP